MKKPDKSHKEILQLRENEDLEDLEDDDYTLDLDKDAEGMWILGMLSALFQNSSIFFRVLVIINFVSFDT